MIAHFVYNLDSYSGAAFQALSLISHSKYSSKSIVFNIGNSSRLYFQQLNGIVVIHLPRSYFKRLIWLVMLFVSFKVKIVHLHGFVLTGLITGVVLRKKIILKTTLSGEDDFESLIKKRGIYKFLLRFVDKNIAISSSIFNKNTASNPSRKTEVIYIPNGVDTSFQIEEKSYSQLNFVTVGVVTQRKRTYEVIKYFKDHYSLLDSARLYIVGPTPEDTSLHENSPDYYKKCLNLAGDLKNKKIFFTGRIDANSLYDIYAKSFCFLFFSEKEGMPNCLLEAMSFNCVPIVTDIGGVSKDIIIPKYNGFIIDSFGTKIEIDKLIEISKSKKVREAMIDNFSFSKISKIYSNIYASLLP